MRLVENGSITEKRRLERGKDLVGDVTKVLLCLVCSKGQLLCGTDGCPTTALKNRIICMSGDLPTNGKQVYE